MLKELKEQNTFVFVNEDKTKTSEQQNGEKLYDLIKGNEYVVAKKTCIKISNPEIGLGVFATEDIEEGEIIEILPLLIMGWREHYQRDPQIKKYAFANTTCQCRDCQEHGHNLYIMLGNGSIYNHADTPNTFQTFSFKHLTLKITARHKISKGEELFINYGDKYFSNGRTKFDVNKLNQNNQVDEKPSEDKVEIKEEGIIKEIENFITNEDSEYLIDIADKNLKKMTVLGSKPDNNYRVADGTWLSDSDEKCKNLRKRISEITNFPVENMEQTHIVKYNVGGEYKVHHDFFHENTDYYQTQVAKGGQRSLSALIYLNDDFEGGETDFPKLKKTIKPKKNKLVIWKNLKDNGELNHDSLHAGLPVTKGTKYICIIWIREKSFK
jgi:prolyl 4-hydroxylase